MRTALIVLALAAVLASPQEKKNRAREETKKRAEALKKMAQDRGDVQFNGRLYKQEAFRKMCKPKTLEQLTSAKATEPISIIGKTIAREDDTWMIATKRGAGGWTQGKLRVIGTPRGQLALDELFCFYGKRSEHNNEMGFEAYLVGKPTQADLGLVFRYEVQGDTAVKASTVQEWQIVGEVANTGRIDYSWVEVEAVMTSAGDSDAWHDVIRELPASSKKPFRIKLSGYQGQYIGAVSKPKFDVYIKDFEID